MYSSLPLDGPYGDLAKAVNDGAQLALQESGRPITFVPLNAATPQAETWTPFRVDANARRAAGDATTLAYIGEFYSGASQISLPILNEAGIPVISPSATRNGLTKRGNGAERGEPGKYYPTGATNFFRIVPNDTVQAAAIATAMRDRRCKRTAVVNDGEVYGRGLAADIRATARRLGLRLIGSFRIDPNARSYRGLGSRLRHADCIAYGGTSASNAVQLFKDLPARARLFGGDGVTDTYFARLLPKRVAARVTVAIPALSPQAYAVYGHEAMKLILDGYTAGATNRAALIQWLKQVKDRPSALGTYSFDASGDTTLRTYGLYKISNQKLTFVRSVTAA